MPYMWLRTKVPKIRSHLDHSTILLDVLRIAVFGGTAPQCVGGVGRFAGRRRLQFDKMFQAGHQLVVYLALKIHFDRKEVGTNTLDIYMKLQ